MKYSFGKQLTLICCFAVLASGCGGSGGSTSTGTVTSAEAVASSYDTTSSSQSSSMSSLSSQSSSSSNGHTQSSSSPTESDTAMAQLSLANPKSMQVYENGQVLVPMTKVTMGGEYRFAKITSHSQETLFLGQLPKHLDSHLPMFLERRSFPLTIEIFSERPSDDKAYFEVTYASFN